ncbi:MAG: hypothetical protein ABH983_01055 [Candidatus Micrarchaeota archaeon]
MIIIADCLSFFSKCLTNLYIPTLPIIIEIRISALVNCASENSINSERMLHPPSSTNLFVVCLVPPPKKEYMLMSFLICPDPEPTMVLISP